MRPIAFVVRLLLIITWLSAEKKKTFAMWGSSLNHGSVASVALRSVALVICH